MVFYRIRDKKIRKSKNRFLESAKNFFSYFPVINEFYLFSHSKNEKYAEANFGRALFTSLYILFSINSLNYSSINPEEWHKKEQNKYEIKADSVQAYNPKRKDKELNKSLDSFLTR